LLGCDRQVTRAAQHLEIVLVVVAPPGAVLASARDDVVHFDVGDRFLAVGATEEDDLGLG